MEGGREEGEEVLCPAPREWRPPAFPAWNTIMRREGRAGSFHAVQVLVGRSRAGTWEKGKQLPVNNAFGRKSPPSRQGRGKKARWRKMLLQKVFLFCLGGMHKGEGESQRTQAGSTLLTLFHNIMGGMVCLARQAGKGR